jgi:hypothetical protein
MIIHCNPRSKIQNPKSFRPVTVALVCLLCFTFGTTFAWAQAEPDSAKREPARPVPLDQQVKDLRQKLSRELGPAAISENENPLLQAIGQMQQAESLLANPQAGAATKKVQDQIVATLDRLLASCQNSSPSPGGQCKPKPGGKEKPGKPGSKPGTPGAKPNPNPKNSGAPAKSQPAAGRHDAADVRMLKDFIAKLPQHDRVQVEGSSIEEFLPKYQALIEAYFRDLTEQQTGRPSE